MIDDLKRLLESYQKWLIEKTEITLGDGFVKITAPYIDRHNDYIQLYAIKNKDGYILTDDGHTIADLEQSGCKLDSPKRKQLLNETLNGFGVTHDQDSLLVIANPENFPIKKHSLIQAILAVNDLFYMAESTIKSLFFEDVQGWLNNNKIEFNKKVKYTGKSGYIHNFDFVIPSTERFPARLLSTINKPTKSTAESMVFSWIDTKEARGDSALAYAVLNDSDGIFGSPVLDALRSWDVKPILWSERDSFISELRN